MVLRATKRRRPGCLGGLLLLPSQQLRLLHRHDADVGLDEAIGVPLTWKVPTYVTVGPASFWNGNPNGLGTSARAAMLEPSQ